MRVITFRLPGWRDLLCACLGHYDSEPYTGYRLPDGRRLRVICLRCGRVSVVGTAAG